MTFIKICGITTTDDARAACTAGADALGVIFARSKRQISTDQARQIRATVPASIPLVGVFMDQPLADIERIVAEVDLDLVQLHGSEPPDWCTKCSVPVIKRHDVPPAGQPALHQALTRYAAASWHLLDPGAGSGQTFDWELARDLPGRIMVSGGLNPDNVAAAIRTARPAGVDVASGVEREPGHKDHDAITRFVQQVRAIDAIADHS